MRRPLLKLTALAAGLLLAAAAHAQTTHDEIKYRDREKKRDITARGTIREETPAEVAYQLTSGRTERVPALDVIDITYRMDRAVSGKVNRAVADEEKAQKITDPEKRRAELGKVLEAYREALKMPELRENDRAYRHVAFRTARLLANLADEDAKRVDEAIDALKQFNKDHGLGWQVSQAYRLLGRLQAGKGDLKGARATYEELAGRVDVPDVVRQEADMLLVRALMAANDLPGAEKKLKGMSLRPVPKEQSARLQAYLAACQAATDLPGAEQKLKAIITSKDQPNEVKGLAANLLADCYLRAKRPEDAFWQYLWVDVVYNQDREEHAKALYQLAKLFEQHKKQPQRAQACRDRLLTDKQFAGLEYQRLAAKAK
ncbi:MAG TPA: hypothetical protein VFA26_15930 [Gemmataceae bacterium]|nr:hypothetical protein [Gemmataceae bacterium]